MKVYLAARYSRRGEMCRHADKLIDAGHSVTSRWLIGHDHEWTGEVDEVLSSFAIIDIIDVDRADVVISYTEPRRTPVTGGGRHVEFGYAYAKGKKLVIIGERENIFHHLPGTEFYASIEDWIAKQKEDDIIEGDYEGE